MTPQELIERCEQQQATTERQDAKVYLRIYGAWWGKRKRARLYLGGPLGQIVGDVPGPKPGVIAAFRCDEVIAALHDLMAEKMEANRG